MGHYDTCYDDRCSNCGGGLHKGECPFPRKYSRPRHTVEQEELALFTKKELNMSMNDGDPVIERRINSTPDAGLDLLHAKSVKVVIELTVTSEKFKPWLAAVDDVQQVLGEYATVDKFVVSNLPKGTTTR